MLTGCTEIKNPVYICTSFSAECFHNNRQCEGLQRCGSRIKTVSLEEAQSKGRRPCHYCYGIN